jgi:hypothetical protein
MLVVTIVSFLALLLTFLLPRFDESQNPSGAAPDTGEKEA